MPTLLERGRPVDDPWVTVADGDPLPSDLPALVSLARWVTERAVLEGRNAPLGVSVPGETPISAVAADTRHFSLIEIRFAKFRDGRGFTLARALREHHGYDGEIRASGHVLPDQYQHLVRCGFSTVLVGDGANLETWSRSLNELTVTYQPAVQETGSFAPLRRYLSAE